MANETTKRVYVFRGGGPTPIEKPEFLISSRAVRYGAGLFETLRVYSSVVPFLEMHLERVFLSAKKMSAGISLSRQEITHALEWTIGTEGMKEGIIEILFPINDETFEIDQCAIVSVRGNSFDERMYERGARALVIECRKCSSSRLSGMTTFNYLENILARNEASQKGYDEAIFLNERGNICDGSFSNLFFVKGKVIYTPSLAQGIVPGVTREKILEIARNVGLKIFEGKVSTSRLKDIDEAFMTSSIVEVVPIVEIGKQKIGEGIPGFRTKGLHTLYRKELQAEIMRRKVT